MRTIMHVLGARCPNYGGTCRTEPRVQHHNEICALQQSRFRQTNDPETYTRDESPVLPAHVLFAPETLKSSAVVHQILVRSWTSAGGGTVGISIGAVAVGVPTSRRGSRVGPGIPESISTSKFHFVPRASIVSRRLHCSPGGFLRTDLHSSKPCFVPAWCSSDDASRPRQQPLIHLFVNCFDKPVALMTCFWRKS